MNVRLYPGVPFGSARAKPFLSSVQLLQRLSLALRETRGSLAGRADLLQRGRQWGTQGELPVLWELLSQRGPGSWGLWGQ